MISPTVTIFRAGKPFSFVNFRLRQIERLAHFITKRKAEEKRTRRRLRNLLEEDMSDKQMYTLVYEKLGVCGCGSPEDGLNLLIEVLRCMPLYEKENQTKFMALIGREMLTAGLVKLCCGYSTRLN